MDSYERTVTALKRQQPDRVPVFCYIHDASSGLSDGLKSFILANADVMYSRVLYTGFQCTGIESDKTDRALDDGWVETTHSLGGMQFSEVYKSGEKADYIGYRKHLIRSADDMRRVLDLGFVKPEESTQLNAWVDEINSFGADHCSSGAFFRIAFLGPLGILAGAMGPEDFAMMTIGDEDLLRRYLDVALEREVAYLDYVLGKIQWPLIVNVGGAEYAIPPLMSPKSFYDYVLPYDRELINVAHRHGKLTYYHSHGKVRQFIPGFIEMGADGLHPLEPTGATGDCDLAEVKKQFGKDICLVGNIQYDDLCRLTRSGVEQLVRQAMDDAKDGGGLILSPSCTPYHNPMPRQVEDNLMAFVEAGITYGQY